MSQQKHVVHTNPQRQKGQHLRWERVRVSETSLSGVQLTKCLKPPLYFTCVVAALKERPSREQRPSPAATDRATNSTPASPTAPWDLAQSHLSMVTQA